MIFGLSYLEKICLNALDFEHSYIKSQLIFIFKLCRSLFIYVLSIDSPDHKHCTVGKKKNLICVMCHFIYLPYKFSTKILIRVLIYTFTLFTCPYDGLSFCLNYLKTIILSEIWDAHMFDKFMSNHVA